jgi:hypothetical protein
MTKARAAVSYHSLVPRQESPSEVYELRRQASVIYNMADSGVINAGVINPAVTGGFMKTHGVLDEAWNCVAWSPNPSFDFAKILPDVAGWNVLEPNIYSMWRTVKWQLRPVQLSGVLHDLSHHLLRVSNDPPFSAHEDIRASNILVYSSADETPLKRTAGEKRYKELNEKYYAGTLTRDETVELARIEAELDDADARDLHLNQFAAEVEEGYDKLQVGLRRINGILDELLKD